MEGAAGAGQAARQAADIALKYEEDWRVKVEKVGSELYDAERRKTGRQTSG